jgi:hypothetical protein
MKHSHLAVTFFASVLTLSSALAGNETKAVKEVTPLEPSIRTWFPDTPPGFVTLGSQFSDHATGLFADSITGLWAPKERDAFFFLNSRYHWEDNSQFISSTGLGFRKLLPTQEIILGANAFYDSINSAAGNDFDQLGLGVEVLTHWVDARFNYYLPDNDHYETGRRTSSRSSSSIGPEYTSGAFISQDIRESNRRQSFRSYEAALEGFNAEVGFLVPGLDRYAEVRLYAGYYHYDNPFGSDYEGFKARLEARVLPGVVADLEYWDDAALMGGHWTGGVRVSVPFSIYNLVTGRNPFAGIAENFTPRKRAFRERMGDMIERSHRIQTTGSGDMPAGNPSTSTKITTVNLRPSSNSAPNPSSGGSFPVE